MGIHTHPEEKWKSISQEFSLNRRRFDYLNRITSGRYDSHQTLARIIKKMENVMNLSSYPRGVVEAE